MSRHTVAATSFLKLASGADVRRAFALYVAPNFKHHNPYFRGDAEALATAMEENVKDFPEKKFNVERVLADDDLVAVHSRVQLKSDMPEMSLVHIFRFEGDRIAELWDIGMPTPDKLINENGMF